LIFAREWGPNYDEPDGEGRLPEKECNMGGGRKKQTIDARDVSQSE